MTATVRRLVAADGAVRKLIQPNDLIASAVVDAVMADMEPEYARELAAVDPLALEAFAATRVPTHGQRARLQVRDSAIAALARSGWDASEIARELARYAGTSWNRDRLESTCPARYVGTPRALFWLAMKCVPRRLTRQRIVQLIENIEGECKSAPPLDLQRLG
jgi:hypothetical protein